MINNEKNNQNSNPHQKEQAIQDTSEQEALQIMLKDHIMAKLYAQGELEDFTLKCLEQSCSILKPHPILQNDSNQKTQQIITHSHLEPINFTNTSVMDVPRTKSIEQMKNGCSSNLIFDKFIEKESTTNNIKNGNTGHQINQYNQLNGTLNQQLKNSYTEAGNSMDLFSQQRNGNFQTYPQLEIQVTNPVKGSQSQIQLPSVEKIEEVININKQSVIEHILLKKRDQKLMDKQNQMLNKNEQFRNHTPSNSEMINGMNQFNQQLIENPLSLHNYQQQTSLLNNLQEQLDLNTYLQQQLLMQDNLSKMNQNQMLSNNQFAINPLQQNFQSRASSSLDSMRLALQCNDNDLENNLLTKSFNQQQLFPLNNNNNINEGQQSLSFLPLMNQNPFAVSGQSDFSKKRFVERIDEIDHEVIKDFAIQKSQNKKQQPKKIKTEKGNTQIQKQNVKVNEKQTQKMTKKNMKQNLTSLSLPQSSEKSSTLQVGQKAKVTRASSSTKQVEILANTQKKMYDLYSHTETESEIGDEDSEDASYEKQLSRSAALKSQQLITETKLEQPDQNTEKIIHHHLLESQSDLHHSKRPKRSGAKTNRYSGYDQMIGSSSAGKHDHSHYQLIQYSNYKSLAAQPFVIYISIEAQIMLNIHSHLSEYEVIGFLGGYCFESQTTNQKYLIISTVIPCDSLIENQVERQKNVDLCPVSANNARMIIQSRGQQVLGWYHSHPFFPVEPSLIDIRNHAVYQKNFDLENMPFVALIIGPYSTKNRNESLQKVFHLIKEKQPFSLIYKQMPSRKIRRALVLEIKELFIQYKSHKDRINLREKWSPGQTREDKLVDVIYMILEKNMKQKDKNDIQNDLASNLSSIDYQNLSQNNFNTLSTASSERSYSKSSELDNYSFNDTSGLMSSQKYEPQLNNYNQINQQEKRETVQQQQLTLPQTISQQNTDLKKDSYISIENDERVEKFMIKLKKLIKRIIFNEEYVPSDEE
eukprot:403355203